MQLSKNNINRLGKEIYELLEKGLSPTSAQLEMLQNMRLQYKEPLKLACDELTQILNRVDNKGIITYRVKRIESIINKIKRNPRMALARMQDIAGIRCILENEKKIYQFYEELKKSTNLCYVKEKDYIKAPKENGYKSLHVILKSLDFDVEIQLRDNNQHTWATLVEITDQIFKTKIKEYNDDKKTHLLTFFKILSKGKNLTNEERAILVQILKKTKFIQKITNTFTKNANILRKHWCNTSDTEGNFFLFEVTNKDRPTIYRFSSFTEAEIKYFENFDINNNKERNMVMAFISSVSFKTISKAYSNYILIKHTFYNNLINILQNITDDEKLNSVSFSYLKLLYYARILVELSELVIIQKNEDLIPKNSKYREWKDDVYNEIKKRSKGPYPKCVVKPAKNFSTFLYRTKIAIKIKLIQMRGRYTRKFDYEHRSS